MIYNNKMTFIEDLFSPITTLEKGLIVNPINNISGGIGNLFSGVGSGVSGLGTGVGQGVSGFGTGIGTGVGNIAGTLTNPYILIGGAILLIFLLRK
jgi:hypothetical protein